MAAQPSEGTAPNIIAGAIVAEPEEEPADVVGKDEEDLQEDTKKLLRRFTQNKQTVERDDVMNFVAEQQMERDSFNRLPFTIFFFVIFAMAAQSHESVTDSGMVSREMRSMLEGTTFEGVSYTSGHKSMEDIDVKEDIWNYLREAAVPLFINSLSLPREDLHRVLRYNQIIGGVVLQQTRRKAVNCGQEYPNLGPHKSGTTVNPLLQDFYCYPWTSMSEDCFGPALQLNESTPRPMGWCHDKKYFADLKAGRRLDFIPDGGGTGGSTKGAKATVSDMPLFSVFMYEHEGITKAIEKLNYLEANQWVDANTAWMGMRILVMNPDLSIFVHITMSVYMPPSGAMLPKVDAQSFTPEPYQYMSVLVLDILFCLCVLWLTFSVGREFFNHARRQGGCREYFSNFWHVLDLANVVFSYVLIILWLILLDMLQECKGKAMAVRDAEPKPGESSAVYPSVVDAMHTELYGAVRYLSTWRICLTYYTILIAMKFLESFAAQPRLAVVTQTISRAGCDMFHFGIVMLTIFLSYCVAGMFLFGRRVWDFSSEPLTMNTCFLMMMGDFDWESLAWEHPFTAGLWFWSYMVVMQMLMLNMLMAIIMDVYTEVKSEAAEFPPVWTQIYEICLERWHIHKGEKVSDEELIAILSETTEQEIDADTMCRIVGPGLSKDRAVELIDKTKSSLDHNLNKGVTLSEAMRMIGSVKITVQKIHSKLEEILTDEKEEQSMMMAEAEKAAREEAPRDETSPTDAPVALPPAPAKKAQANVADAAERMDTIDVRLAKIESFMQESLQYSTFRGKDLRNRMAVIEDLVRNQRDMVVRERADMWDQMPAPLGSSGRFRSRDASPPRLIPLELPAQSDAGVEI